MQNRAWEVVLKICRRIVNASLAMTAAMLVMGPRRFNGSWAAFPVAITMLWFVWKVFIQHAWEATALSMRWAMWATRARRDVANTALMRAKGLCPGCGYDLRGNTSGVCPECGRPLPRTPDIPPAATELNDWKN
jgi:hypothetical protein